MYYKFEWTLEDETVESITFDLLPVHGDSDMYVSEEYPFPNKTHYDKRSMRVGGSEDKIEYQLANNSEARTFHIGVYGYTYATYALLVKTVRSELTSDDYVRSTSV